MSPQRTKREHSNRPPPPGVIDRRSSPSGSVAHLTLTGPASEPMWYATAEATPQNHEERDIQIERDADSA